TTLAASPVSLRSLVTARLSPVPPAVQKVIRMNKSGIHIQPSHKGLLHSDLGVPQGQPIPAAKLEAAKHSSSPAIRRRANFAENAKPFHHGKRTHYREAFAGGAKRNSGGIY